MSQDEIDEACRKLPGLDHGALIRLVGLVARTPGARPGTFQDRLLEFVRPAAELMGNDQTLSLTVRVCRLCLCPVWHSSFDGDTLRAAETRIEVTLAGEYEPLWAVCHDCDGMRGRYPEPFEAFGRLAANTLRLLGAPAELLR